MKKENTNSHLKANMNKTKTYNNIFFFLLLEKRREHLLEEITIQQETIFQNKYYTNRKQFGYPSFFFIYLFIYFPKKDKNTLT